MTVLNTAYGHMTHKIFTNLPKTILNHGKAHQMEHFGESKSTFVNMTWIDILEFLLWNMEVIVSFNRGEYFILIVPFQFKCAIRFIGLQEFQYPEFISMKPTKPHQLGFLFHKQWRFKNILKNSDGTYRKFTKSIQRGRL